MYPSLQRNARGDAPCPLGLSSLRQPLNSNVSLRGQVAVRLIVGSIFSRIFMEGRGI